AESQADRALAVRRAVWRRPHGAWRGDGSGCRADIRRSGEGDGRVQQCGKEAAPGAVRDRRVCGAQPDRSRGGRDRGDGGGRAEHVAGGAFAGPGGDVADGGPRVLAGGPRVPEDAREGYHAWYGVRRLPEYGAAGAATTIDRGRDDVGRRAP